MDEVQATNQEELGEDVFKLGNESISKSELEKLLISNNPEDKEKLTSIIIEAVTSDFFEVIMFLLDKGYQVDVLNEKNQTLVHLAYYSNIHSTINELMFSNCKNYKNYIDCNGLSHLHIACATDNLDSVRQFLDNGENIHSCLTTDFHFMRKGSTPLHFAVAHRKIEVTKLLLQHGADINAVDSSNCTPIHLICSVSSDFKKSESTESLSQHPGWLTELNILILLIDHNCDLTLRDNEGNTPLLGVFKNNYYCSSVKKEKMAYKDLVNKDRIAIYLQKRQLQKFDILYELCVDINAKNYLDENILHCIIQELIFTRFFYIPECKTLIDSVYAGMIEMLLQENKELDVNAKNNKNETPIALAVSIMNYDIVKVLLDHNVDFSTINIDGHNFFRHSNVLLAEDMVSNLIKIMTILKTKGMDLTLKSNLIVMKFLAHDVDDCNCGFLNKGGIHRRMIAFLFYYGSPAHTKRVFMKLWEIGHELVKQKFALFLALLVGFSKLIPYPLAVHEEIDAIVSQSTNNEGYQSDLQDYQKYVSPIKSLKLDNGWSHYDVITKPLRSANISVYLEYADGKSNSAKELKGPFSSLLVYGHVSKSLLKIFIRNSAYKSYIRLILPSLPDLIHRMILEYLDNKDILRLCEAALLE